MEVALVRLEIPPQHRQVKVTTVALVALQVAAAAAALVQ
jgi:hypothetical protein